MRSNDLKIGEHYAYSNQRSASSYKQRVRVVEIGVEISSGYYGKAHNGVLVEFLDEDGSERRIPHYTNPVVRPGSLHWPWAKEIENKAVRESAKNEFIEDQKIVEVRLRELVENANEIIGSNVFIMTGGGARHRWTVVNDLRAVPLAKLIVDKFGSV